MPSKKDEFLQRLIATFRDEADEHIRAMSDGITELAQSQTDAEQTEAIERMFREAHSLKGAARAVNFTHIESMCQAIESVFARMKDGSLPSSSPLLDLMLEAIDGLTTMLSADGANQAGEQIAGKLMKRLENASRGEMSEASSQGAPRPSPPSAPAPESPPDRPPERPSPHAAASPDTVRISTAKLGKVMRQGEEMLLAKLAAAQRVADLHDAEAELSMRKKLYDRVRPMAKSGHMAGANGGRGERRQESTALAEFVVSEQHFIRSLGNRIIHLGHVAGHDHRALSGMVDGLLQEMREMLMLPFSSLLETLPHLVRELARDRGKQVTLHMEGGDIEIDRRILEGLKDPFIHLLRNSIDHGIEKPDARREKLKSPSGTISIAVTQVDSGKVEIIVADDGAGIDAEKVMTAASKLGLAPEGEPGKLDELDAIQLVFHSGLSTSPIISELSGRGLGLAIVHENIERLGGTVSIDTHAGEGTRFRMMMPLTLATFRGVLVRAGGQMFAIPVHNVDRVVRIAAENVRTVENRETIHYNDQTISLVRLGAVLGLSIDENSNEYLQAVIINPGFDRIAFQVEEVIGEQEVLVKMLGKQLVRVRNVSGAAVLGTGEVVPVLNVIDLMKSAVQPVTMAATPSAMQPERQSSILVAEDSITSRTLLKSILESAGYRVVTAVDGIDAYTALKTGEFDLLVSDVDMPRMNGFDLTAKVRADKQCSDLPVVLVTSLSSQEHRERGIDVGANAYIVKSSFDQSNLLEVIERLI